MSTALITGANRGLGLEFARQYAAEGWRVLAACRDPSQAQELEELAKTAAGRLTTLALDVASADSVAHAAQQLQDEPIDVLINCAGVMGAEHQTLGRIDYEDWLQVLEVNTLGPLRVIEAFAGHIERGTRKLIVTLTSGMGSIADNNSGGWIAYRSSKAALNMAVKCAAINLAPRHIACVLITPGWVRTDMGGPHATLTPEQSVAAMRRVFGSIRQADTGRFFNYDGRTYPW
jgi:NAD(P)-dependent dehydrogenase (short-subunit alcohol dehydrogenase family)